MPLDEIAYVSEMLFAFIVEYLLRPETAFGGSFQIFETKNKSKLYKRKEENNY